jgi:outer membrane cobalamin receptor
MPSRDIKDIVSIVPSVVQTEEGGSLNIRGSRAGDTQYIVDGIKVNEGFSVPKSAIAYITVITGGIPAQFGDATGGIIIITTKNYMSR